MRSALSARQEDSMEAEKKEKEELMPIFIMGKRYEFCKTVKLFISTLSIF